jgi:hypothetical protein
MWVACGECPTSIGDRGGPEQEGDPGALAVAFQGDRADEPPVGLGHEHGGVVETVQGQARPPDELSGGREVRRCRAPHEHRRDLCTR